ncbi:MAG TPA: hypothetical protein VLH79_10045 [Chthonomonadales bacterium]|nr:hypothetical protein [Chthonomonadales bacterium]
MSVDDQLRRKIDDWLARSGLNKYGDRPGTVYAGGSPLMDERTGHVRDRYEYILEKHPELRSP